MIKIRVFIIIVLIGGNAASLSGQKYTDEFKYLAFDANWRNISNIDSATYFSRIRKVNDTCWEVHNYNLFGPMISKEFYKDEANNIAHGEWVFYKTDGYMDSICNFRNNMAHGNWYFFNDTGRLCKEKEFKNGRLIAVRDIIKQDSIKKANEDTTREVERDEKESEFRGGVNSWIRYLQKNLRYPERAIKNVTEGKVIVQFVVDREGNIEDIDLYKSVEYTLDDEAQRLIINSPKWTPGMQDGKKVKTFKLQPIVFRLK